MKKYILFFVIIFFSLGLFAVENKNRIAAGFSIYCEGHSQNEDSSINYAPCFSYERQIPSFFKCDEGIEASFFFLPSKYIYSFSLNVKFYIDDFSGLLVEFSPLSNINFGNLFLESPYLNYGIGTFLGYKKNLNKTSFESKVAFSFPVYDKGIRLKINFDVTIGLIW